LGQFLVAMVLIGLLIAAGVFVSVRIRLPGKVHFRRVRRSRTLTPMPDGTTVEETIVETTVEEAQVEEES
jgi:hypothetical protein